MLKGTVSLVTGGASGLGQATVQRMIEQEGRVVLCDLPKSKGVEVAKAFGVDNCVFVPVDVTKEVDVVNALAVTKEKFGKLDYVLNCAGTGVIKKTYDFDNNTPHCLEAFNRVIQVNVIGTFNVIRLAVGLIAENEPGQDGQRGVIINCASIAAYEGRKLFAAYAASKGAVVSMTLPLARELASHGIRVCAIAPGPFKTPMFESLPEEIVEFSKVQVFPERPGNAVEFAMLVQTIIENPMLNGEVIRLDGAIRG